MAETHAAHETPRLLPEALRGTHRVRQRGFMVIYVVTMLPVAAVAVILFVYVGSWLLAVVSGLVASLLIVAVVLLRRRVDVDLQAEGVVLYRSARPRRIAWAEVQAICALDRWHDEATIDLAGERGVALLGVDEQTARRLVDWFHGSEPTHDI